MTFAKKIDGWAHERTFLHDGISDLVTRLHAPKQAGAARTKSAASNRTSYAYDPATGRRIATTNALGQATHHHFDPEGRLLATWGATYPVAYEYDDQGRMTAMYTYRGTNEISAFQDFSF